jgi:2-polyprenyl-6-methoxyphenol hydroxylase-like FAD-dependent oxidoreductase
MSTPSSVPVAIVGAGPVGLALALGLARHGVDSVVLEREPQLSRHSKAAGIHVRTRDALRRWGVEDRFLTVGNLIDQVALHDANAGDRHLLRLDLRCLDDEVDRPGLLVIEQNETERLLWDALRETGRSEVRFGTEVTGLRQDPDGVTLQVRHDGAADELRADHVVGCDGPGSTVRGAMGLPFEGTTYRLQPMLADVDLDLDDERDALPWPRLHDRGDGLTAALRLRPGRWRIIHLPARAGPRGDEGPVDGPRVGGATVGGATGGSSVGEVPVGEVPVDGPSVGEVPVDEVARRAEDVLGPGPVETVWRSRFRIHRRASPRFRAERLLLAGDAAHVHSPVGGQGMNAGIQDAHALAWRLAAVRAGGDTERLLSSYDHERRAVVVGEVARFTDLLTRVYLQSPWWARRVAFAAQRTAMRVPRLQRAAVRRFSMVDLRVPPSELLAGERAAGVRLPDPVVVAPDGSRRRLHGLLPFGPALLEVTDGGPTDRPPQLRVDAIVTVGPGGYQDPTGKIRALLGGRTGWVLVRPDGVVAWARTSSAGLAAAIDRSLGRPRQG